MEPSDRLLVHFDSKPGSENIFDDFIFGTRTSHIFKITNQSINDDHHCYEQPLCRISVNLVICTAFVQSLVWLFPLLRRLRLAIIIAKSSIIRIHLSMGIAKATWLICSRLHRYHHCCKFESLLAQPGRHHDYNSLPLLPKALEILLMTIITDKSTTIRVYLSMGIARAQFLICSLHLANITSLLIAMVNHKRTTTIRVHLSMGTARAPLLIWWY